MNERAGSEPAPSPNGPRRVIVVFGAPVSDEGVPSRTLIRRVRAAEHAVRHRPDALLIVTGGAVTSRVPEAQVMRRMLIERGVAADRILLEDTARNTLESSCRTAELIAGIVGPVEVLVASSYYHVRRCRILLHLAGIDTAGTITPRGEHATMTRAEAAKMHVREALALLWGIARLAFGACQPGAEGLRQRRTTEE